MNKSSIVIVSALALVVGFWLSWLIGANRTIELETGTWFGDQARALPEFQLLDHNRQNLTRADLNGKWNLIFFGYTHCPDICPASLQTLADMMRAIDDPDVAEALRVYFVSVDPGRDKPEVLASYVSYFNPDFIGATAEMDKLTPLTKSLGIAHAIRNKVGDNPVYDVDHSAAIVLINPKAEFAGLFGAPHDALALARDMTRIVEYN
ncbi:MAG: SCO family protein [Gammaproteobacteria bacterium]|nr:MAG: SCO family protein [Gammaproteobacteria bacterium]UCH38758.1 MAG: SCO family protein [Gammaproteobacteria bacterium]